MTSSSSTLPTPPVLDGAAVRWFRRQTRRHGAWAVVLGSVLASVAVSTLLVVLFNVLLYGGVTAVNLLVSAVVPATVALLAVGAAAQLADRLDEREARIRQLIAEDPLTGTFNRQAFLDLAEREWDRSGRHGRPLGLLLMDVVDLAAINAHHGERAGDAALQAVVRSARQVLRSSDLLARLDGGTFAALLTDADTGSETQVMARLLDAIGGVQVAKGEPALRLAMHHATAARSDTMADFGDLMSAAEVALQDARDEAAAQAA